MFYVLKTIKGAENILMLWHKFIYSINHFKIRINLSAKSADLRERLSRKVRFICEIRENQRETKDPLMQIILRDFRDQREKRFARFLFEFQRAEPLVIMECAGNGQP